MEQSKACQLHLSVLEVLEESLKCHNDETTVNALKAVGSFCQDDECVRVFLSHKIHECFIKLLRHKQVELQVSSIYVMSLMSSRDQYCKVLDQDVGSFQAIVILGMHSKPEIRYYIAVILLNLANNGYIRLLMQSDSVSLLVNLSRISDPKTQQTAALTLGKIMLLENMPAQDELSNFGLLLERNILEAVLVMSECSNTEVIRALLQGLKHLISKAITEILNPQQLICAYLRMARNADQSCMEEIAYGFSELSKVEIFRKNVEENGGYEFLQSLMGNPRTNGKTLTYARQALELHRSSEGKQWMDSLATSDDGSIESD
eukprot:TRINITY_DN4055_c0_g1_i9.p1 TRINITY_DN4055_c0_g1~~TRINITY_DN4055_c0_g1_i9.p1  ORF type:complete len:318 (+),score=64.81 TRINITY_DN4055_c0_g1_i9:103-1056(+)